jgi:Zn-dependent peptidase ImmA (M78 family)
MRHRIFFTTIFFIAFISCTSFDQEVDYKIDPLLKPSVDKFYDEALKRGIYIQKTNLIAIIDDKEVGFSNAGQFQMVGDQIMVLINKKYYERFLRNRDTIFVERLVMHELGHALLNRNHTTTFSIMNSGSYYYEYKKDSFRIALIDELFTNSRLKK